MWNFRKSDRYDGPSLFTDLKARRSSLYSNSLFNRKPMKSVKDGRYMIRLRSSANEPCSVVVNFLKFVNELLRTARK